MKLTLQETLGGFNGPHFILTDEVDYTAHVYELSGPSRVALIVKAVNTHARAKALLQLIKRQAFTGSERTIVYLTPLEFNLLTDTLADMER